MGKQEWIRKKSKRDRNMKKCKQNNKNGDRIYGKLSTHTHSPHLSPLSPSSLTRPGRVATSIPSIPTARQRGQWFPEGALITGPSPLAGAGARPPAAPQTSLTLYEALTLCGWDTLQLMTQLTNIIKAFYFTHDKGNMRERRLRLCA